VASGCGDESVRGVTSIVSITNDVFVCGDIRVGLIASLETIAEHVAIFRFYITDSELASSISVTVNVLLCHDFDGNMTRSVSRAINVVVS